MFLSINIGDVMLCPCCGEEYNQDKLPSTHLNVVKNTKVGYPWYPSLTPRCVFVGAEPFSGNWILCSLWLWEWHDERGDDVAVIGTLRIVNKKWNWEFSRMDGTGAEELTIEVFGVKYERFWASNSLAGYRAIDGDIK